MRLYVNVDHVATIREARKTTEPDPLEAAHACLAGGADGITVHLREDRRHIQDRDVRRLADAIREPLNLELAAAGDIVAIALEITPHQATLVPEHRQEITTEGGLDMGVPGTPVTRELRETTDRLHDAGIRVSVFIDPDRSSIDRAAELGVPAIELHTGDYANTYRESDAALRRLEQAVAHAKSRGLAVHAGHGLTYRNVSAVAAIGDIEELNIGHAIVSRSVLVGMEHAVREMRNLIDRAR
ncbi:MAG: pyridoxine 5'-phosphate synthase [Gemmatimonadota bacterium]|nr:pyridoxine 5'-phosphate synthase [Gemmatimonadota bacterium]